MIKHNSLKYCCKWCGTSSNSLEDFEEDWKSHTGFWCPNCDGFTYFSGCEVPQKYKLYLEENLKSEPTIIQKSIKLSKRLSPLRYPGGKSKLIPFIYDQMDRDKPVFVEPYCGGASVGLSLLNANVIDRLILNDLDFGIYSLFYTILNDMNWLKEKILNSELSRKLYFRFRKQIKTNYNSLTIREAAYATLVVNRLAFSGIPKANPKGNLTERWNPIELIKRIERINSKVENIELYNLNANEIIEEFYWNGKATLFIDPPYYVKGKDLYNLALNDNQHKETAELLNHLTTAYPGCADIIITYDNADFIKNLYPETIQHLLGRNFSIAN